MAQLPLKQGSWAIYVPKNDIFFAIFCAGFSPYFFSTSNQAAFLGHLLPLIRQNQAANAHIDGATPSYLARDPKTVGLFWALI